MFSITVQLAVTAENGLEDLVDIGGGLNVDFLVGFETDIHTIKFKGF